MIKKILQIVFVSTFLFAVGSAQTNDAVAEKKTAEKKSLSYGLLVDNSASMRPLLEDIIKSAGAIIESNQPEDEAFLVRFVDAEKTTLLQDFTASKEELQSATEDLFVEGGQTAILDSVYFSAKHLAEKANASPNKARFLILITDGEEGKSQTKIGDLLKFLKTERIKIYALGLADEKLHRNLLDKLAKETGGKSFMVEKRADLKNTVKELTNALRAQ